MKHRPRPLEQADLLRPRLVDMIDGRHELVRLAGLIDWPWFEREWAGFFPAGEGRPATHPRLVAGLMYLQHAFNLSDEAVLARWVENPYFQHFTGETCFQHRPPIHPSSLSRWRGRIGEEGVEWLLTKTIEAGRACGAVTSRSLSEIAVDTTVMEKAIAHPTDSRLYERARCGIVTLASSGWNELVRRSWRHAVRGKRHVAGRDRQPHPMSHETGFRRRGREAAHQAADGLQAASISRHRPLRGLERARPGCRFRPPRLQLSYNLVQRSPVELAVVARLRHTASLQTPGHCHVVWGPSKFDREAEFA